MANFVPMMYLADFFAKYICTSDKKSDGQICRDNFLTTRVFLVISQVDTTRCCRIGAC